MSELGAGSAGAALPNATLENKYMRMLFERWSKQLSLGGILLGVVFFALSLTPSLLPRSFLIQGLLSGCVFAAGYALGTFLQWLWRYLELRPPSAQWRKRITTTASILCALMALYFLWRSSAWQNSIRELMGMAPVEAWNAVLIVVVAILPAAALIAIGAVLAEGARRIAARLHPVVPRRLAFVLGEREP